MKTGEFHESLLENLKQQLEDETTSLLRIKDAAQEALALTEAYGEAVSDEALQAFARKHPECATALQGQSRETK
ncbi:MAG: hypothetical protein UX98_C0005G0084 [Parcubacteria group bacterium GW2011_GWA2_47_26]|nr:MAG: hypothetical protein UX98_C0005G0084 [Parcubacteria group bacterium GW2011_GWA2_47_26]